MTKHLHVELYPGGSGKWIVTRLDLDRLLRSEDGGALEVTLERNLHHRLTRARVVAGAQQIGHIYFSRVAA